MINRYSSIMDIELHASHEFIHNALIASEQVQKEDIFIESVQKVLVANAMRPKLNLVTIIFIKS